MLGLEKEYMVENNLSSCHSLKEKLQRCELGKEKKGETHINSVPTVLGNTVLENKEIGGSGAGSIIPLPRPSFSPQ